MSSVYRIRTLGGSCGKWAQPSAAGILEVVIRLEYLFAVLADKDNHQLALDDHVGEGNELASFRYYYVWGEWVRVATFPGGRLTGFRMSCSSIHDSSSIKGKCSRRTCCAQSSN
jgi:hypothetical protein